MKVLQWENYYFKWLSNKIDRLCDLIDPIFSNITRWAILRESHCHTRVKVDQEKLLSKLQRWEEQINFRVDWPTTLDPEMADSAIQIGGFHARMPTNQNVKRLEARLPTNQSNQRTPSTDHLGQTLVCAWRKWSFWILTTERWPRFNAWFDLWLWLGWHLSKYPAKYSIGSRGRSLAKLARPWKDVTTQFSFEIHSVTHTDIHTPVVGWVQQSGQGTGGWEVLADPASRACCSSPNHCSFPPCCSRSPPPTTSSSPQSSRQTPLLRTPASLKRGWCWRASLF